MVDTSDEKEGYFVRKDLRKTVRGQQLDVELAMAELFSFHK